MMKNKKIYVLLTDTGTLFTRMIKLYIRKLGLSPSLMAKALVALMQ